MKTAIIYYSMSGNTEFVANEIAKSCECDFIRLIPEKTYHDKGLMKFIWGGKSAVMGEAPKLKNYSFNAADYDTIILGTPVWASSITPPLRTFIKENLEALGQKKIYIYFCFSGGGADKALEKFKKEFGLDVTDNLILVDPKDKPSEENKKMIADFCGKINK